MKNSQVSKSDKELSISQKWINQHCSSERYILIYFTTFRLLHRLKISPQSGPGKSIIFISLFSICFGLQLTATAIMDQWDIAPIETWVVINIVISLIGAISSDVYYKFGLNVSSIGHTVEDEEFFYRQIKWDEFWFNLRITGAAGVITSVSLLISILYINYQSMVSVIPAGSLVLVFILAYNIGEVAGLLLIMCYEPRNFSKVDHALFRFNPIETESIQRVLTGYYQFGLATSLFFAVFIVFSAVLLPNSAYLSNPVWLLIIFVVYLIVIMVVIIPRNFVQQIVRKAKRRQLKPIRQKINNLFDQMMNLNDEEYAEMLRLNDIQDMIYKAPDSVLPLSTIGRIFSTLFLPTITLIITIVNDVYFASFFKQLIN